MMFTPRFVRFEVCYRRVADAERALTLGHALEKVGLSGSVLFNEHYDHVILYDAGGIGVGVSHAEAVGYVESQHKPTGPVLDVVVLAHGQGLPLPAYETAGASAMDLRAAIPEGEVVTLRPGERKLIPTGLSFAIPTGFEAQVRGRSGLAIKHGIGLVNGLGTIDSDYRGETCVIMINHGQEAFSIQRGDRIAQLVIAPVVQAAWRQVDTLDATERGAGGFGSTGR